MKENPNHHYYKIMKLTQPKFLQQIEILLKSGESEESILYMTRMQLPQLEAITKKVIRYIKSQE